MGICQTQLRRTGSSTASTGRVHVTLAGQVLQHLRTLSLRVSLKGEAKSKRLAFRQKREEVQEKCRGRSRLPTALLTILNKIKFKLKPCNHRAARGQGEADRGRVKPGLKCNKAVIQLRLWDS